MEVDHYGYSYPHQGQLQEDVFYNQGSMSPPSEDLSQAPYCSNYTDPMAHMWAPGMHPFHASMHWTQYSDINQPGVKMPAMSAHSYAIARRNERERNRVRHINSTFERLRKHLPPTGRKRKLSKVDTLRTAIRYIEHLQDILDKTQPLSDKDEKENSPLRTTSCSAENVTVKSEKNNNNQILSPVSSQNPTTDNLLSCCRFSDTTFKESDSTLSNDQCILRNGDHMIKDSDLNANMDASSPEYPESIDNDSSWTDPMF